MERREELEEGRRKEEGGGEGEGGGRNKEGKEREGEGEGGRRKEEAESSRFRVTIKVTLLNCESKKNGTGHFGDKLRGLKLAPRGLCRIFFR
jgi:hypothetical protein